VARENTVRLSDEELQKLKKRRDDEYTGYVPLGFVIGDLCDDR